MGLLGEVMIPQSVKNPDLLLKFERETTSKESSPQLTQSSFSATSFTFTYGTFPASEKDFEKWE